MRLLLLALAFVPLPGFHSPSGNIRCFVAPGGNLLCSVSHADYATALQARCMGPGGAGVDWHGWQLRGAGKGGVSCSGGILYNPSTQRPTYVNLPYGRSWRKGPFTCVSRLTGVTCTNTRGHGLFISRGSWRAW